MGAGMNIDLQYPIDSELGPIRSVTLRRAKVRDLKEIDAAGRTDEFRAGVVTLSLLSGLTEAQVGDMDAEDFVTVMEATAGFLPQRATDPNT